MRSPRGHDGLVAAPDCNAPSRDASVTVSAPGNPFQALPSVDGCWVFVSIARGANEGSAIAVYRRSNGTLKYVRETRLAGSPAGMALTSDGKLLVVADNDRVAFIDTDRLVAGRGGAILGYLIDAAAKGRIYANVTADDKFAFVADENSATVSVIDLARARATGFNASGDRRQDSDRRRAHRANLLARSEAHLHHERARAAGLWLADRVQARGE